MAVNEFKLAQSTAQVQELFNLLTANSLTSGYMLVTNGNKGVKFTRGLHAGDNSLIFDSENAVRVDINVIKNALNIPSTDAFEAKANKSTMITASSTDAQYPSAKAVYDALNTLGFKDSKQSLENIDKLVQLFEQKSLESNILYIASISISNGAESNPIYYPTPCIFMQSGDTRTVGNPISLIIICGNIIKYIRGKVTSGSSILADTTFDYDLRNFVNRIELEHYATNEKLNQLYGTVTDDINAAVSDLRSEVYALLVDTLTKEY